MDLGGVSQRELGRRTGISQATLSRICSGEREASPAERRLIEIALAGVPELAGTESQPSEPQPTKFFDKPSEHKARPGIRRVFVCIHETRGVEDCRMRVFCKPEQPVSFVPQCPEHGPMVRQANHPYRGESTEPSEERGWPPAVDGVKRRDEAMARALTAP